MRRFHGVGGVEAAQPLLGAGAEQRAGGQADAQGVQVVAEPVAAGHGQAETGAQEFLQFLGVADTVGGEAGAQRFEVGVQVPSGGRGPGQGAGADHRGVRGGGHTGVQADGGRAARGDVGGFVEGAGGRGGDRVGDAGAERGEDVQDAGAQSGSVGGAGEVGDGGGPAGRQEGARQVGEDGDPVGEHLGGAELDGLLRPVQGVAPGLVADQVQVLGGGRLHGLVHEVRRGDGAGGVVGGREHEDAGVAALGADPADGLQERVRVGHAAAFCGDRHVEDGPAERAGQRCPPGGARPGHQHVPAERGGEGDEEGGSAGRGDRTDGARGQPAAGEVARGGVQQGGGAAHRGLVVGAFGGRAEGGGQARQDGQSLAWQGRPVPDGTVPFGIRPPHGFLRAVVPGPGFRACPAVLLGCRAVPTVPMGSEYPGSRRVMGVVRGSSVPGRHTWFPAVPRSPAFLGAWAPVGGVSAFIGGDG